MPPESKKNERIDFKAIFAGAIFAGGLMWAAHSEISKVNDRLDALDKHISRVETAVRIIGAKQGGDTKTLIDEALTVAKNAATAGHTEAAKAIVDYTNRLLEAQKESKSDLPQQFFETAWEKYQSLKRSPSLRDVAQAGALTLAEYRTAVIPSPSTQGAVASVGSMRQVGQFTLIDNAYFVGEQAFKNSPEGTVLDYLVLNNVTFENATIVYHGGPVTLANVRFINCRFIVPDSPKGDQLLASAVRQPANTSIG